VSLFSLFFQTSQSQLGALFLDVLVTEQLSLPSKVTAYPIETGDGEISDHITQMQEELTITGAIAASSSEFSLQNVLRGGSFGIEFGPQCFTKMIDAIDQLRTMHKDRKPITIVTGLGKYEDMAFTTLTIERSNNKETGGQWLNINTTLRKIKKVTLKTADLPPEKASTTSGAKGKTGTTEKRTNNTTAGQPAKESSLLKSGKDSGVKAFNDFFKLPK
jgi:hypothetical protein